MFSEVPSWCTSWQIWTKQYHHGFLSNPWITKYVKLQRHDTVTIRISFSQEVKFIVLHLSSASHFRFYVRWIEKTEVKRGFTWLKMCQGVYSVCIKAERRCERWGKRRQFRLVAWFIYFQKHTGGSHKLKLRHIDQYKKNDISVGKIPPTVRATSERRSSVEDSHELHVLNLKEQ